MVRRFTRLTLLHLGAALSLLLAACRAAPAAETARQPSAIVSAPPAAATAVLATPTPRPTLASQVDAYLGPLVTAGQFSGAVLIARDGQVLLRQGYGLANREHDVANTPQTTFRLGSVTKQFTAMAILLLEQQGKLTVQDRICTYVFECPTAWQDITIHHLLTHTSGIRNFTNMQEYQKTKTLPTTPVQTIARFKDMPLDFAPGTRWSYSNSGYLVLGAIIERVARQPYPQFLREQIFDPLQMDGTGYETELVVEHRAQGYTIGGRFTAAYVDMSQPHAAGGLYSTVEDLYRWDQALYTEQLVPQAARDAMFTAHHTFPAPEDGGYGYGWVSL